MSQDVTDFIAAIDQPWQAELCRTLDQRIREAVPGVEARLQYRKPHYLKDGSYLAVLGPAKGWVSLTIFNARDLDAPEGTFEPGGTPDRRTVRLREGQDVDDDLLARLIRQAAGLA